MDRPYGYRLEISIYGSSTCQHTAAFPFGGTLFILGGYAMGNRVAMLGIVVEKEEAVEPLNALLHQYRQYVIGRMGIPYRERGINLISIVVDAPGDAINTLAGKLGGIQGLTVKTLYARVPEETP